MALKVLAATALVALVTAPWADASLWLRFNKLEAAPGDTVVARTLYAGAFTSIPLGAAPVRVFLVSADLVNPTSPHIAIDSPDDDRLIEVGVMKVDGDGNGELVFTVPHVPDGSYTTITYCVPCAPYSAGRELVTTGPTEPFVVQAEETNDASAMVLVALAVAVGLLGLCALVLLRRSRGEDGLRSQKVL